MYQYVVHSINPRNGDECISSPGERTQRKERSFNGPGFSVRYSGVLAFSILWSVRSKYFYGLVYQCRRQCSAGRPATRVPCRPATVALEDIKSRCTWGDQQCEIENILSSLPHLRILAYIMTEGINPSCACGFLFVCIGLPRVHSFVETFVTRLNCSVRRWAIEQMKTQ